MPNIQLQKNMKDLREESHLTQDELAKLVDIARSTYANYENGARNPDTEFLMKFSRLFGLSIDALLFQNTSQLKSQLLNFDILHEDFKNYCISAHSDTESNYMILTEKELQLILNYRSLPENSQVTFDTFLSSQLNK